MSYSPIRDDRAASLVFHGLGPDAGALASILIEPKASVPWVKQPRIFMSPRLSSAVLLRRKKDSQDQVYLVERNPKLRFFGGYHALPGGVVSQEELVSAHGDKQEAAWRCALRELFEETGVLACPGSGKLEASARGELRESLIREEQGEDEPGKSKVAWEDWAQSISESPFRKLGWMSTPPFAPLRYETLFLDLEMPEGEETSILTGELVSGRFWAASEALQAWRRGEILIVPPVLLILELMEAGRIEELDRRVLEEFERLEAGKLHPVRFSPGIFMAALRTPTLPPATTTNTLLVGEDRIYIVDPGTHEPEEQERLYAKLESLLGEGRALEGILLTHSHNDHLGALRRTALTFDLCVLAHEISLSEIQHAGLRTRSLSHGDRLDLGSAPDGGLEGDAPGSERWQLEVIHTPGHHPGHLCFQENRYHALIAGDMISTVSTIVIDPPEGHLATYLASLELLLTRPKGTLYPAHGPAVPDSTAILHDYLAHRCDRERALLSALCAEPRTLPDMLPEVYRDVDPALYPIAARSLLAGLHKLEEEGRARQVSGSWRLA